MDVILEDNSFTMDTREARLTRLKKFRDNIEKYAAEISLDSEILDWGIQAFTQFNRLLAIQSQCYQEKNKSFLESSKTEKEFYNRYIAIKELLISKQNMNIKIVDLFKLDGAFPSNKLERIEKASELYKLAKENRSVIEGLKIPYILFENLEMLIKSAKDSYLKALKIKEETLSATSRLNRVFDKDSEILRQIFNWVVAFWGKKDPRLNEIGFTQPKSISRNDETPAQITNLKIVESKIVWAHLNTNVTYQLAWKGVDDTIDFKELYSGKSNRTDFFRLGKYKVRAKNDYGFGPWSQLLDTSKPLR